MKPYSITVRELVARGPEQIPEEFIPACHLIYSSPATLFYNSPGAVGFGVKRAALVLPESAMLLVSPNACGRNSTVMSTEEGYADRMFYLPMTETDLVTGRHLSRIPEAIHEIMEVANPKPKAIVICITCVDALLGTDLPRICRKAEAENDVLVLPSYMYAIEREGKRPPMVAIRETLYSLLERPSVDPRAVNLLGFFSELDPASDLFTLLKGAGIRTVNQISAMKTLDDYYEMGKANFNLVLHPESVYAASTLQKRLNMPYLELHRLYDPDRIHNQYRLFGAAVGVSMNDGAMYEACTANRNRFAKAYRGTSVAIGEMCNANSYELATFLCRMGLNVPSIFSNLTAYDFPFLAQLAELSPETRVYTGISPSMVHYEEEPVDLTIGKDAAVYCPHAKHVLWNSECQPFGYTAVNRLLSSMDEVLCTKGEANPAKGEADSAKGEANPAKGEVLAGASVKEETSLADTSSHACSAADKSLAGCASADTGEHQRTDPKEAQA